jgi:hypothetical protein
MPTRRFIYLLLAVSIGLALAWCSRYERPAVPVGAVVDTAGEIVPPASAPLTRAAPAEGSRAAKKDELVDDFPLAALLNAPNSTIFRDLDTLSQILDGWRTLFPRDGNPVGENHEITAALTGDNRLELVLIPENHPAINPQGELCDRWGTPFRFHQLSGERMEIHSAGPDRKFGTDDDASWSPGS